MKPYLAVVFAKQLDSRSFLAEVAAAIKSVAGANMKYGDAAASVAAIAFITDKDAKVIHKAFADLWRPEQRVWVFPIESPIMVDKALMDWIRKNCQV